MFIFEGSDNVGKSTAIRTVRDILREMELPEPRFYHDLPPWKSGNDELYDGLGFVPHLYTICDRLYLGWLTYGVMADLHPQKYQLRVTWDKVMIMERLIKTMGCYRVILYAEDSDWYYAHLCQNPKKEEYEVDKLVRANEAWKALVRLDGDWRFYDVRWDVSDDGFPEREQIEHWVDTWISLIGGVKKYNAPPTEAGMPGVQTSGGLVVKGISQNGPVFGYEKEVEQDDRAEPPATVRDFIKEATRKDVDEVRRRIVEREKEEGRKNQFDPPPPLKNRSGDDTVVGGFVP